MKQIIIVISFMFFIGCRTKKVVLYPNEEFEQEYFYYEGDSVTFKVDSIADAYNLPVLPNYKNWKAMYYRGIHKKDSMNIKTYYLILEKNNRDYIFNVIDIEEVNFKQFKFITN